jgi:CRP-like cAMP-binding protein
MEAVSSLQVINRLLAALPLAEWTLLRPALTWVELPRGSALHEAGDVLRHVYFPVTAVVSLVSTLQDGSTVEVASVGREGVVGVCAFMGGGCAPTGAVVQSAGQAWRMAASAIVEHAQRSAAVLRPLLRYAHTLVATTAQTAACNRHHALEQQLCRWLLVQLDQHGDRELAVTHERIGALLGVRRESVTHAALKLQQAGLVQCGRGHIAIADRAGLASRACECYAVLRLAHEQLAEEPAAAPARRWPARWAA